MGHVNLLVYLAGICKRVKLQIGRCCNHTGKITDIIKTGRQVNKIPKLIFRKLFELTGTLN